MNAGGGSAEVGAASTSPAVAVAGLGLIGGSLARALAAAGVPTVGFDRDPKCRTAAHRAGLDVVATPAQLCSGEPDVLVLAVPLREIAGVARQMAGSLSDRTLVTDVGSVKASVRRQLAEAGVRRYVGAHPMAGTEHSGFASSDAAMLDGARWAVTVDETTPAGDLLAVLELVLGPLAAGGAYVLADDVHDRAAALISHVPHVLGTELLGLASAADAPPVALGLAAGSFRDVTRVARTDPRRTEAMVVDNAREVAVLVREAARDLERLARDLDAGACVASFFDRPDPIRSARPEPEGSALFELSGAWRSPLAAAGAAGWAVVGVDRAARRLTLARR